MRVALLGRGELFRRVARAVQGSGHSLVGVITPEPRDSSLAVVPLLGHDVVNSGGVGTALASLAPDLLLVASWHEKLGPSLCAVPKHGCVNCHPSLLPAHRGPNPYLSAIVAGDSVTGVSFHRVTGDWDAGPVLLQRTVPIADDDTGGTLRSRCSAMAAALAGELLDGLSRGTLQATEQNHSRATCFPAPRDRDLAVDWRQPAAQIHRWIRGVQPWSRCYSHLQRRRLEFVASEVVQRVPAGGRPGSVLAVFGRELLVRAGDADQALRVQCHRPVRARPGLLLRRAE